MNLFANMYHVGMAVADIDAAAAKLGKDLNIDWAPIKTFDPLPFWTPERGMHEVTVKATYSRQGPQHMELVWCPNSPFYNPNNHPDARHIGVWGDDLATETERLRSAGWQILAAGGAPDDGYGILAYLRPPFPAMIVELVSPILKPVFAEWISEI